MFKELREKYNKFIYEKYSVEDINDEIVITYYFSIEGLKEFRPTLIFSKEIIKNNNINNKY